MVAGPSRVAQRIEGSDERAPIGNVSRERGAD